MPVVSDPQAEVGVAGQAHALAEQLQVGADGDALVALSEDRRVHLHLGQQLGAGEALALQVIEQALQVGDQCVLLGLAGQLGVAPRGKALEEEAALVAALLRLDQEHALEGGFVEDHAAAPRRAAAPASKGPVMFTMGFPSSRPQPPPPATIQRKSICGDELGSGMLGE